MPGGLDGSRLMDEDMPRLGGNDGLVGPEEGGNGDEVRLRAAGKEMDVDIIPFHAIFQISRSFQREAILAVPFLLHPIRVGKRFQDIRMRAFAVIIAETIHSCPPDFDSSDYDNMPGYCLEQPISQRPLFSASTLDLLIGIPRTLLSRLKERMENSIRTEAMTANTP